jgi:hypothetical protein
MGKDLFFEGMRKAKLFIAPEKSYLPYYTLIALGGSRRAESERLSMRDAALSR